MNKKTVIITGASRGIGKSTAEVFAKNNYNVVINYNKSQKQAEALLDDLKQKKLSACIYKADVSDYQSAKKLIDFAISYFGDIDVLVNNCGVSSYSLFTDCSEADFNKIINVNIKSALNCSKFALPYMIKKHSGKIINVSSIWGLTGASCEVIYSMSKAAIIGFTKALAKEEALSNINVNCVAPGSVETDMMLNEFSKEELSEIKSEIPMQRFAKPEEIAEIIYFLASKQANYITGQVISPNGGIVI